MTEEASAPAEDHDADEVVDRYKRSVRNIIWYTLTGLAIYGTITGLAALTSWWFRFTSSSDDADTSTGTRFTFTLDLANGATVLGMLTTLMIALHVVAWQIKPVGPLANLVHARRRLLAEIAGPLGFIAIITGAATVLHGAPDEMGVGQIAVGVAAVVVAVFAIDIEAALSTDQDLHRKADDVSRQRDTAAVERVAARWATARTATVKDTLWDFAKVYVITTAPLLVILIIKAESHTLVELLTKTGIALLCGVAGAALTVFVIYGAVLHFVTRNHLNLLLCVLTGALWVVMWLITAVTGWTSDASMAAKIELTGAFVWFMTGPAALIAAGLRADANRHLPGRTVRAQLYATLERRRAGLAGAPIRNEGSDSEETSGFLARQAHRYKVVTGTEPDGAFPA